MPHYLIIIIITTPIRLWMKPLCEGSRHWGIPSVSIHSHLLAAICTIGESSIFFNQSPYIPVDKAIKDCQFIPLAHVWYWRWGMHVSHIRFHTSYAFGTHLMIEAFGMVVSSTYWRQSIVLGKKCRSRYEVVISKSVASRHLTLCKKIWPQPTKAHKPILQRWPIFPPRCLPCFLLIAIVFGWVCALRCS